MQLLTVCHNELIILSVSYNVVIIGMSFSDNQEVSTQCKLASFPGRFRLCERDVSPTHIKIGTIIIKLGAAGGMQLACKVEIACNSGV